MVRVGGGWVALDEFLVKNDPCRGESVDQLRCFSPAKYSMLTALGRKVDLVDNTLKYIL